MTTADQGTEYNQSNNTGNWKSFPLIFDEINYEHQEFSMNFKADG